MGRLRWIGVLALSGLGFGCASIGPKPMPDQLYPKLAQLWVGSEACMQAGHFDLQTAANGRRAAQAVMNSWSINQDLYQMTERGVMGSISSTATRPWCNSLALGILELTNELNRRAAASQAASAELSQINQALMQQRRPVITNCNRFGNQVNCMTW